MFVINILMWLYNLIKGTNFDVILPGSDFWNLFSNIMAFIGLVIPLDIVLAIMGISLVLFVIRLVIAIYKLIPFI